MSLMESLNGKKKNKRATVTISFKGENRAVAGGGKKKGGGGGGGGGESYGFVISFSRERNFSLRFREIQPSKYFGTRRKVVLRGEANAWALVLRSPQPGYLWIATTIIWPGAQLLNSLYRLPMFFKNFSRWRWRLRLLMGRYGQYLCNLCHLLCRKQSWHLSSFWWPRWSSLTCC